ncbi:MAG: ABC transporter ATP-binding protein, partial [Alphaproteobacteria bacterium]|nr:ABC transporter ATP-binding protein [Alphaproteobacteria bacterium]
MGNSPVAKGAVADTPEFAINIKGLTKKYKASGKAEAKLALDNVDLAIPRGSLFGLLGPNGAGKSTMINIMAGLVLKTAGQVSIWGSDIDQNPRNAKASIGIVPQELNIDPFFTPEELLDIQAGMYGVRKKDRRTEEILKSVGLWDKRDAYARTLSGGMRRRMLIGKAMVHNPPILVLDEPTAGVDIELRQQLWENVVELNKRGTTILLTTHYLEEAEELCDEIAIINHGKVVAHDDKKTLLGQLDAKTLKISVREALVDAPDS